MTETCIVLSEKIIIIFREKQSVEKSLFWFLAIVYSLQWLFLKLQKLIEIFFFLVLKWSFIEVFSLAVLT